MQQFILLFIIVFSCNFEKPDDNITSEKIYANPGIPDIKGKFTYGFNRKDKLGDNYLILSRTKDSLMFEDTYGDYGFTERFYLVHYKKSDGKFIKIVQTTDFVEKREFDLTLNVFEESFSFTYLNKNGIAEYTFAYSASCRSDVSPSTMKILLYENGKKYALRGTMVICPPDTEKYGEFEDYKTDESFNTAPQGFYEHARKTWIKFQQETF